jgi:hypothetical protein
MPLTREELIRLKHQIEPNDYRVVESGMERILVVRSPREFPDIVNDLDCLINKLDIRDTNELNNALIIGEEEVVGVPLQAIDSLITRRAEEDEQIATDLGEKLIEPYTTLLFESENDPLKTLRLGIRIRGLLKDFKAQELPEILFSKIKSLPRHSEVVYLIAEDGYIRLSGTEFYRRLREFLKEYPNKNKELAKEFIYMTRGRLADHFVDDDTLENLFETSKQENINTFVSEIEATPHEALATQEKKQKQEQTPEPIEISKIPFEQEVSETGTSKEIVEQVSELEPQSEPELEEKSKEKSERELKEMPIPGWKAEITQVTNEKPEMEVDHKQVPEVEPEETKQGASPSQFLTMLLEKLPTVGMEQIPKVEIPGVDLAVNNPGSFVSRIFFTYMPDFSLQKALTLERSIERFSPELSILVTDPGVDIPEMKLFVVGKNILIVDIDKLFNTDFLIRIEEHI